MQLGMIPQFLHKIPELSIYSLELHSVTQLKPFELTNKFKSHNSHITTLELHLRQFVGRQGLHYCD